MKSKILKSMIAILCLPVLLLCGCSDKRSKLPKINASAYFESSVSYTTYGNTKASTLEFEELIMTEPDPLNVNSFDEIKVTAKSAWVYKMYIDAIYFYVYANKAATTEMIVNVKITNLADEDNISKPSDDFAATCSLVPLANDSVLCKVEVKKTIATATGCTLSFDILNSTNGTVADDNGKPTDFRWMIYGLEIYAEHRTY